MAVVNNFWLRDNKQRLGGAVIYQSNGQTLMRQLAPAVSNPRTDAQMETRVKLANLVAFYRASAGWMRGAFETKPANQSDYNAFVSANATNNNVWLTKSQVDAGNAIVAPYQVTRGSLGEITQKATASAIYSNLYVGELAITEATTVAQFTTALLGNNNGILEGDQISLIQYIQNTSTDGNYTITCRPYEVVLSLSDGSLLASYLPVDLLVKSADDTPALGLNTSSFTGGAAFIISRTYGGRILVSSSAVTLTSNNAVYTALINDEQKKTALRSYGSNTIVFLDSNAAGTTDSDITTNPTILSLIYEGRTYIPGSELPNKWIGGNQVTLVLSAPVTYGNGAAVDISIAGSTEKAIADYTGTDDITSALVQLNLQDDVNFEFDGTSNVQAYVEFDTTMISGILKANFQMAPSGLE